MWGHGSVQHKEGRCEQEKVCHGCKPSHQGPPLPRPRTCAFLHLGSTCGAAQPRTHPSPPGKLHMLKGTQWMDPRDVLRCLSGLTTCLPPRTAEAAWTRSPSGRPGPDDCPVRPFEQLVQLSLLAFSPSEVGGALILEDPCHHSGEKTTNR